MPTSLASCANTGVSLLDLARTEPLDDPHASLQAVGWWHFGPEPGSRYYPYRAKTLKFDPLTDIKTFEDLLDDPMNKPTVTQCVQRPSTRLPSGAPDPDDGCLTDFLVRKKGFIRD